MGCDAELRSLGLMRGTHMHDRQTEELRGKRILVVEDDYIIAIDLALTLEECGAEVIGPAGSVADACELIASEGRLDGAVLDINLGRERAFPIADELRARGVPFVFATGYDAWIIPDVYREVPRSEKPVDAGVLSRLLRAEISARSAGAIAETNGASRTHAQP